MTKDHLGKWKDYWTDYVEAFAHPLTANGLVGRFVANPNVTGAYAETWLRSIAASMLPQYRISTGAVLRPSDRNGDLRSVPQCDLIIWDPSDMPALFEKNDFALVPWYSARAIIEIKRSCTDVADLRTQLEHRRNNLLRKYRRNILGVVVSHPVSLFEDEANPKWLKDAKWDKDIPITRLLGDDPAQADTSGVLVFIYFLSQLAGHGTQQNVAPNNGFQPTPLSRRGTDREVECLHDAPSVPAAGGAAEPER